MRSQFIMYSVNLQRPNVRRSPHLQETMCVFSTVVLITTPPRRHHTCPQRFLLHLQSLRIKNHFRSFLLDAIVISYRLRVKWAWVKWNWLPLRVGVYTVRHTPWAHTHRWPPPHTHTHTHTHTQSYSSIELHTRDHGGTFVEGVSRR